MKHGANTETHGEEALIHGCHQSIEDTVIRHFSEIGLEIELEAFHGAVESDTADRQQDDQKKQCQPS